MRVKIDVANGIKNVTVCNPSEVKTTADIGPYTVYTTGDSTEYKVHESKAPVSSGNTYGSSTPSTTKPEGFKSAPSEEYSTLETELIDPINYQMPSEDEYLLAIKGLENFLAGGIEDHSPLVCTSFIESLLRDPMWNLSHIPEFKDCLKTNAEFIRDQVLEDCPDIEIAENKNSSTTKTLPTLPISSLTFLQPEDLLECLTKFIYDIDHPNIDFSETLGASSYTDDDLYN